MYILKACIGWNFSQDVIAGGRGWNENVLAGKILYYLIIVSTKERDAKKQNKNGITVNR